jgi:hypothetical protein
MKWRAEDITSGVPVTKPLNERYNVPALIIHLPNSDQNQGWGICELSDGFMIGLGPKGEFGTKEDLANSLNDGGFFPLPKMMFKRGVETLPENRLGIPMLLMTHCGT